MALALIPITWRPLGRLVEKVQALHERDLEKFKSLIGYWPIVLAVQVAPSWVALLMIYNMTTGGDPVKILLGAVITAAVGAGAWRSAKAYAIGSLPGLVMYHLILYARPLAQAGAIVLASWFLLIAAVRLNWELIRAIWMFTQQKDNISVPLPLRILAPVAMILSVVALVIGARWLLQWHYGADYDVHFEQRPLPWPLL